MMGNRSNRDAAGSEVATEQLLEAAGARKCWACGCLASALSSIDKAVPRERQSPELQNAITAARAKSQPPEIECRGCDICYPAVALNALADDVDPEAAGATVCPAADVSPRDGWPPLAGNYTVLGYRRPVAICTLNNERIYQELAAALPESVAIVGLLSTENLGIERLVHNVTANPNIRFLIVCGEDARRQIGHLPGDSLIALSRNGVGKRSRIIGARGKRPVLRNIEPHMIEHFRHHVDVIDLIGTTQIDEILDVVSRLAERNPGPAQPLETTLLVRPQVGHLPDRVMLDPNGYFIIYPDRSRGVISLEHYSNEGVLTMLIEGKTASELYHPAIKKKLLSRLDHACYLGRELAKAEQSLKTGQKYVQDAAPELSTVTASCGCARG